MPRTAATKRQRSRTVARRRGRKRPRRLRFRVRRKRTRRRARPVRRRTRTRRAGSFPLVPLPARKNITLVWRQTLHVPVSSGRTAGDVIVLKMNDPSDPIFNLPHSTTSGYEVNPENGLLSIVPAQPLYHDIMRKMYKGCHVRSSSCSVRATPAQHLLPTTHGAYGAISRTEASDTAIPPATNIYDLNAINNTHPEHVAQPFRLCITTDEDAYEDLLGSHRAYKARDQDSKFSSIKTLRTQFRSATNSGAEGAFTKAITSQYNFRKFWDLPASVLAFQTKYHRTLGSRRRLIADESASGAADPNYPSMSTDDRIDFFAKNRDLIRWTKPWNSYAGENPTANNSGWSPGSPAFLRIQALPTDHIRSTDYTRPPMVKVEITMKFDCTFFDPTELIHPTADDAAEPDKFAGEGDNNLFMDTSNAEEAAVGEDDDL